MKPRAEKNPYASYSEGISDSDDYAGTSKPEVQLPKPVRGGSGFSAAVLSLIGIGCAACGVAVAIGPKFSWKLTQIAGEFKDLGLQSGVLVLGGMILVGLGLLRRGQIVLRTPTTEQAEDRLLLEQLTKDSMRAAEDLARLEDELSNVNIELTKTRGELDARVAGAAREVIAAIPPPQEIPTPDEAIFRLAASLDQVGMRIEQRLKAQYTALQDHLEDVGAAILSARNQMQGLERDGHHHAAILRHEVKAQVDCALEETGYWSAKDGKPAPSLGVLDTIEDGSSHDLSGEAGYDQAAQDLESIEAALPLDPEEAREHGVPMPTASMLDEIDTKTRLIQLSTLLSDPKLRKALEEFA